MVKLSDIEKLAGTFGRRSRANPPSIVSAAKMVQRRPKLVAFNSRMEMASASRPQTKTTER
jgi:hypothetical protein